METRTHWTKEEAVAFVKKMVDDKRALCECIRNGGDISKVANERGLHLYNPILGR